MPLPTGDIIGILADNLRLRRSVLPIPRDRATAWARRLDLPHGGETVLYTGLMYQLVPYIECLVKSEKRLGNSFLAKYTGLGRRMNRLLNLTVFMARPSAESRDRFNQVPFRVAVLLKQAGIQFGYLGESDLYSGALAHDLGAGRDAADHARRVYATLKSHGVKNVITIDPHTTNMLRSVYRELIPGYDIEVRSYLEALAEVGPKTVRPLQGKVVLHDPCVFARYEGVIEQPRALLAATGISVIEPERSGEMTWCCGGPVEALYPEKAAATAAKRVDQLRQAGSEIVTMCPMCHVNLAGAAARDRAVTVTDISDYLYHAFVASPSTP